MRIKRVLQMLILSALIYVLSGCDQGWDDGMSRAEVIAAVDQCKTAGLGYEIKKNGMTHVIWRVNCVHKQ